MILNGGPTGRARAGAGGLANNTGSCDAGGPLKDSPREPGWAMRLLSTLIALDDDASWASEVGGGMISNTQLFGAAEYSGFSPE